MITIKESKITTNLQHVDASEVNQTLDRFGMNWSVDKKPLQFLDGIDTYETDFFGVIRSDTRIVLVQLLSSMKHSKIAIS